MAISHLLAYRRQLGGCTPNVGYQLGDWCSTRSLRSELLGLCE